MYIIASSFIGRLYGGEGPVAIFLKRGRLRPPTLEKCKSSPKGGRGGGGGGGGVSGKPGCERD